MYQFHPAIYIALNPELRITNLNMAQKHYIENGKKEGRKIDIRQVYPDFRPEIYLSLNPDVAKIKPNTIDTQLHWLQKGRYENRLYKPVMLKETLFLYTDVQNEERCMEYSKNLKKIGIQHTITQDGNLTTNNLYILFTLNNIKHYPFYFILNLVEYRVNVAVLDLALAICTDVPNIVTKFHNKIYDLKQSKIGLDVLLNRLLISIGYIKLENEKPSVEKDKIHIIHNLDNKNSLHIFTSQPLYSTYTSSIKFIYTIKCVNEILEEGTAIKNIVLEAKKHKLPYVIIGGVNLIFTKKYENTLNKALKYLESIEWDIVTHVKSIDSVPSLIEIIQIDPTIELLRLEHLLESSFMIVNHKLYDHIISWNGSNRMYQHLKAKELNVISLTDLFIS
jgi:hypothetical protein